ncbi:MAG TPA: hypothetical protein VFW11_08365 [Cyclobacteriaceae bacterium]|nr:hypothetical protein [Cyclobacteriaceae bacterium]
MSACVTHKRMYASRELAEEALIAARIRFNYPHGEGPIAVYQCEDCGQYHLTSKGVMNERLAKFIQEGKLKLHKEAGFWSDKLKKR